MVKRPSYRQTLFDRLGPDAAFIIRANTYGMMAGGISLPILFGLSMLLGLRPATTATLLIFGPFAIGLLVRRMVLGILARAEEAVHTVLAGGSSTPYTEQHSYQQALVMQGRLDEALESLEAIIAEPESTVDVRIRAAELYAREAKRPDRAAELLREASRHPACTAGEEAYASNRLADLLSGPLAQPGRALVELRRLADRYTGTPVGDRAREAIRALKAVQAGETGDLYSRAD
jgi:hypothetical protein